MVREVGDRRGIRRALYHAAHGFGHFSIRNLGRSLEKDLRHFIQAYWKIVITNANQRIGQVIYGVVFDWQRTVATCIRDLERESLVHLFARLNIIRNTLAIYH